MSWSCSLPTVLANDTRDWSGRRLAEEGSLEGQKCRSWLDLRSFLLWPPAKSKHLKADLDIYNMSKTCPHVIYCNLLQSIAILHYEHDIADIADIVDVDIATRSLHRCRLRGRSWTKQAEQCDMTCWYWKVQRKIERKVLKLLRKAGKAFRLSAEKYSNNTSSAQSSRRTNSANSLKSEFHLQHDIKGNNKRLTTCFITKFLFLNTGRNHEIWNQLKSCPMWCLFMFLVKSVVGVAWCSSKLLNSIRRATLHEKLALAAAESVSSFGYAAIPIHVIPFPCLVSLCIYAMHGSLCPSMSMSICIFSNFQTL
jgi:hypothetical protein